MKQSKAMSFLLILSLNWIWVESESAPNSRVNFGVNGYPLNPKTGYHESLEQEITQLKTLGLRNFRVYVDPAKTDRFDRLSQLIILAQQEDIQILPVLVIKAKNYTSEDSAYNDARSLTHNLTKQFADRVSVWELGNEYDLYCVNQRAGAGMALSDYDTEKYNVVRGLIKGMLAGLHEGSPSSRSIIQTSQNGRNPDSGFLQKLIQDGVNFDITGFHYYSKDGHVQIAKDGRNALQILRDEVSQAYLRGYGIWQTGVQPRCRPRAPIPRNRQRL